MYWMYSERPPSRAPWRRAAAAAGVVASLPAMLSSCLGRPEEPPFAEGLRQTPQGVVAPASALPLYDADSGVLSLPGLVFSDGASTLCYDVEMHTDSTAPVRLQLAAAVPRDCGTAPAQAARYDNATGWLTLPALPVRRAVDSSCYDVQLRRVAGDPLRVELATAASSACWIDAGPPAAGKLKAQVVLGAPTGESVRMSVLAPDQSGSVTVVYGLAPGVYNHRSAPLTLVPGQPAQLQLTGLLPNARYFYRLQWQPASGAGAGAGEEYRFQTARPPGSRFSFTLQADSHLDENSDLAVYQRTLDNVLADAPDFHIDLGDTFMTEKHGEPLSAGSPPAADPEVVDARYAYEHGHFARAMHSVPLFLVNGNHDGELGWLGNGTAQSLAVWTTKARQRFFVNPLPDGFYGGDTLQELFTGERAAWYAWTWGDAQFIVLDPYWNSKKVGGGSDPWNLTLGERQYRWLADTLARSTARHRFVFLHNLVGGLDGQMRGGVEAAPYFEWGGRNADGSPGFAARRPGWDLPLHALLVRHRVSVVFHGHDHLYARQELDGIVYQEVPQPSAKNFSSGASLARDYHYDSGTVASSSGHLRVTVGPDGVTTEYVRAWLPTQENAQRRNGQVEQRWSLAPPVAAGKSP